ncbi:MAG TPA: HYR domain-containing protein [Lysobacter sp.]
MKRFTTTPARRALLVCTVWLGLFSTQALAAPGCPEQVKFGGPASMSVPDFDPVTGGGWIPHPVTVNGQPSSPNPNQGGVYQWTQVSGPAVVLINADTPKVDFNAPDVPAAGAAVVVRLTVTGCGGSASGNYTVNVTDAHNVVVNAAPHAAASASPASPTEGQLVTLNGSTSWDPDNNPLNYSWQQTGGTAVVLANANQAQASFLAPNVAATTTLTFRLTVSDGTLSDSANAQVNVVWTNDPPVARLSCPLDVNEGASVTLNGSASSDSDDGIASYEWLQQTALPIVPGVDAWDTASVTFNAPSLGFQQAGLVPFVLTVKDASGAASSATCYVFIHDITAPVISGAQDLNVEATSAAGAVATYALTALDAVDGDLTPLLACTPPAGLFPFGPTSVSCAVTDSASNLAQAGFTVTVADTTAPAIDAPISVAAEATGPDGAAVTFTATTTDAVDGPGVATCTPPSGSTFIVGDSTVNCTATDTHLNTSSASIAIHVLDTTPPTLTLPPPQTLEATSPDGAVATFTASASDIVDGNVTVACDAASGDTFALGTTTVHCTATDAHENTAAGSFDVTVQDTTPPAIAPHGDVGPVEATGSAGAAVAFTLPTALDLVDGNVAVTCLPASGSTFAIGTSTVHCSASDTRGNTASSTFNVTVHDTTAPQIYYSGDVSATAGSNSSAVVTYTQPTAWDIVDGQVAVNCSPASGSTFPVGSNTVSCTATDSHGNTASGSFKVNVSYAWNGFFRPVDMAPMLNSSKAGSAIPLKFSLGGNQGMGIMAAGYPKSAPMTCGGAAEDPLLETVTAGSSSLQYDASANQYIYVWKSEKSWAGTCRQIQVKLSDGSVHTANFSFK